MQVIDGLHLADDLGLLLRLVMLRRLLQLLAIEARLPEGRCLDLTVSSGLAPLPVLFSLFLVDLRNFNLLTIVFELARGTRIDQDLTPRLLGLRLTIPVEVLRNVAFDFGHAAHHEILAGEAVADFAIDLGVHCDHVVALVAVSNVVTGAGRVGHSFLFNFCGLGRFTHPIELTEQIVRARYIGLPVQSRLVDFLGVDAAAPDFVASIDAVTLGFVNTNGAAAQWILELTMGSLWQILILQIFMHFDDARSDFALDWVAID